MWSGSQISGAFSSDKHDGKDAQLVTVNKQRCSSLVACFAKKNFENDEEKRNKNWKKSRKRWKWEEKRGEDGGGKQHSLGLRQNSQTKCTRPA